MGRLRGEIPAVPEELSEDGTGRLNSWKEVASYLAVSVRTAQRWEALERLPVRRQKHEKLGSIHAYRDELDRWRDGRTELKKGGRPSPTGKPKSAGTSLAVLPFANLTRDAEGEVLSDGLTEELIVALGRIPGLRIVARTSAFYFKGKSADVREVGRRLGVSTVLEGSLRRSGRKLRVVAQLIQVEDGLHLWSDRFDRSIENDAIRLQDELAQEIAAVLQLQLAEDGRQRRSGQVDEISYERYLRGRFYWNQRTEEGLRLATECFEYVVAKNPDFAPGYAALADCWVFRWVYGGRPFEDARRRAEQALFRALESDPNFSEVHSSLGLLHAGAWEFKEAENSFRKTLGLNPNDSRARHWLAMILANMGRPDEALAEIEIALQLDPLAATVVQDAGRIHYMRGEYEAAIAYLDRALQMSPNARWCRVFLGLAYLESGNGEAALETLATDRVMTAAVLARLGRRKQFRKSLETAGQIKEATWEAISAMSWGETAEAVSCLGRAWERHEPALLEMCIRVQPFFDELRAHPGYDVLVQRMWGGATTE